MNRFARLVLLGSLASCATVPKGPVIGTWHGEPPGPWAAVPQIVDLTLYGLPGAVSGQYAISTIVRDGGGLSGPRSGLRSWSGEWSREQKDYDGQPQSVIFLHDALSSDINQYAIASNGALEPTSAYVGRPLTAREIQLYSLYPLRGNAGRLE